VSDPPADVAFDRRAAYLPAADAVVLSDLHLGRVADSAVAFPLGERADLTDRLAAALERFDPATVAVAGDVLHAFDHLPDGAADALGAVVETVRAAGAAFAPVAGNHDARLAAVWAGDAPAERRLADGTVVVHGHEEPSADADRYVLGHDHPAVDVEGARHPCFLYGPGAYRGADVLVLPAFSRAARGTPVGDCRAGEFMSPLLADADAFRPVVFDPDAGEALPFPPLAEFRAVR
jgi:metallophosphoesterase superfamily enzyme